NSPELLDLESDRARSQFVAADGRENILERLFRKMFAQCRLRVFANLFNIAYRQAFLFALLIFKFAVQALASDLNINIAFVGLQIPANLALRRGSSGEVEPVTGGMSHAGGDNVDDIAALQFV